MNERSEAKFLVRWEFPEKRLKMGGMAYWIKQGLEIDQEDSLEGWVVQAWLPFHPNLLYRSYGMSICLVSL